MEKVLYWRFFTKNRRGGKWAGWRQGHSKLSGNLDALVPSAYLGQVAIPGEKRNKSGPRAPYTPRDRRKVGNLPSR